MDIFKNGAYFQGGAFIQENCLFIPRICGKFRRKFKAVL